MATVTISNPRDLWVQLLGELLFVERRLADDVLEELRSSVRDDALRELLEAHRAETVEHVRRLETVFLRLGVAATSNLSRTFESAVAEHQAISAAIVDPRLADVFHARTALDTEHWELAAYRVLLSLLPREAAEVLQDSFDEEGRAAKLLVQRIDRLAHAG